MQARLISWVFGLFVAADCPHEGIRRLGDEVGSLGWGEDSGIAPVRRDLGAILADAGGEADGGVVDDGGKRWLGRYEDNGLGEGGVVHVSGHGGEGNGAITGALDALVEGGEGVFRGSQVLMDAEMMPAVGGDVVLRQGVGGEMEEEGTAFERCGGICENVGHGGDDFRF